MREWKSCQAPIIDIARTLDSDGNGDACKNALAYACTQFTSDAEQEALLAIQYDECAVVWLNGKKVYQSSEFTTSYLDQGTVKVSLSAGVNTLLAKVSHQVRHFEFAARLRPVAFTEPLVSIACSGSSAGDVTRLPNLELDLLDDAGKTLSTMHLAGGRAKPSGYRYTAYGAEPAPAPANVRIHYEVPGFAPFDESYPWAEVRSGKVALRPKIDLPIRGIVVDAESAKPVPQAQFRVGNAAVRQDRTADDGRFDFATYEPLIDFITVVAAGYEPLTVRVPWPPKDDWTVKLSHGGHTLRGRVLDSDGKPIAAAHISTYTSDNQLNLRTDENGKFETFDLPGSMSALNISVTHSGYIAKENFMQDLNVAGVTEVEWRLDGGAVVTGRVTAKDGGRPLDGVKITVGEDRFSGNRTNPETVTDAEGRYRLTGAKIGATLVHAFSIDFAPAMHSVNTTANGPATADFQLELGATVTGRVTDPDGKPIPGARIVTDTWNNARMFHRERQTDADGKFEIDHMPTTPVGSDVIKQGYVNARGNEFVGGQHYDIKLAPVVDQSIRVKLADTGKPPEKLVLQVGYQFPGQAEVSWQDSRYDRAGKYDPTDGCIHVREDENTNAKRLLRLRAPGYRDAVVPLPSGPSDVAPPDVTLEKAQTTSGRVVDADTGEPLADVVVALASPQDRLRMDQFVDFKQNSPALENFTGPRALSAVDGSFQLPTPGKGESPDLVLLRKGGGFLYVGSAVAVLGAQSLDLPFPKPCTVSGRVTAGGQPLVDEPIHLDWLPPGDRQNQWNLPFGFGGQLTTDQNGQFKFAGLGAGRYQLARVKNFKEPSGRSFMSTYLANEELVILPGQNVVHDFDLPTGCIVTGQTVGADGKPAANCMVTARGVSQRGEATDMAQSDTDGYFTLTYLAPGSYNLTAQKYETDQNRGINPGAMGSKTIKVQAGISPTITVKLQARNQFAGLAARGNPNATLVGSIAPDFTGKLFDGDKSFTLSDQIGKVVVLNFWMSGAAPTRAFTAEFNQLYQKYKDNAEVAFITVSLDQDADTLRAAIKEQQLEFPVIYESRELSAQIAMSFGMRGIPMTIVVDREGKFAAEPTRGADFVAALEAALKKPAEADANGQKPARLAVKFTLDDEAAGLSGTTVTLKAIDAAGAVVREETIQTPGQASQFVWLYPPLATGGQIQVAAESDDCPKQEQVVSNPQSGSEITFAFTSPRAIAGRVAADDGATPVPGVKVTAYRNDGNGIRRVATTDADGQFKLKVFPGSYFLAFEGTRDFAPVGIERETIDVDSEVDPQPVTVEACPAITVTGIVKDLEGKPVAAAQVRSGNGAKTAVTDASGHFELSGVASRGQVAFLAFKAPLVAQIVLTDVDPQQPIDLTLQPQNDGRNEAGLAGKMPRLELHNVLHGELVDWQPAPDSDTLIAFCSLWHPAGRELAQRAQKWADDHHVYVTIVSTDWSLNDARRRWDTLGLKPPSVRNPLYAGPGGVEIAKDWKLSSPAQAYLISPQGKIIRTLDPDKLQ